MAPSSSSRRRTGDGVLEIVVMTTGDWMIIGKLFQVCPSLRSAVLERFGDGLYDTERSRRSRETGLCVICNKKQKAALNGELNCVVHKKCLRNHMTNEYYLTAEAKRWSRLAP